MSVSDQLGAMIFELKSTGSPLAKAKALARAWRMVRRLNSADRRLLAKVAGFDGAEEMVESLAAKKGGVAPAMMMQLLNSLRDKGTDGFSDLVVGLKDPESRDEILMRGADAVAFAFEPERVEDVETAADEPADDERDPEGPEALPQPSIEEGDRAEAAAQATLENTELEGEGGFEVEAEQSSKSSGQWASVVEEETIQRHEEQSVDFSKDSVVENERPPETATLDVESVVEALEDEGSLVKRLLLLHEVLPFLQDAAAEDIGQLVVTFPDGWPRRRAVRALLEADLPDKATDALDLIEGLNSASNRRWCLAILTDRGDLRGADVERAVAMTGSPTLRGRIRRVSTEAL